MPKKVLFCATVDTHFESFHLPYLKWFKEQGWEVHVAAGGEISLPFVDQKYTISIQRSPFRIENIDAYKELKEIIQRNEYRIIHCHTPMGGVISRIAARTARKLGTKVIYTAHGFHFFKRAPLINWALYYPIERMFSHYTDCLITINEEDFSLARNHQFKVEHIKHVHGVGVNTDVFYPVRNFHKLVLRAEHGYSLEDFIMFYAAEFNKNKNQQFLIRALALIKKDVPNARLLLAGEGPLLEKCRKLASSLGVEDMVHFIGQRKDIESLLKMSDVAVASSYREGLPVNVMEAMASGLPIIASDNRGHRELVQNEKNGFLVEAGNIEILSEKLKLLYRDDKLRMKFGLESRKLIEGTYTIEKILAEKCQIYSMFMEEMEELKWAVH